MNTSSRTHANESGAFDMPSIIIGVIVVGILTAGVLATVFGVVPWAQDRAAKQDLAAVVMAQESARAMAADSGAGLYLNKAELVARGSITDNDNFNTAASGDGANFAATAHSGSGSVFWAGSRNAGAKEYIRGDVAEGVDLRSIAWDPSTVMASTWEVTEGGEIRLPLGGAVDVRINWGDGNTQTVAKTEATEATAHKYTAANAKQTITIDGTFERWGTSDSEGNPVDGASISNLLSVDEWGETGTTDLSRAFSSSRKLQHVESIPSTTTSLSRAFSFVESDFTLGNLDTKKVVNMERMFERATAFNQQLNFTNTSNVTNMFAMFKDAVSFNKPLDFATNNVTTMGEMFNYAEAFNQPLKNFDTSNVTDMSGMFNIARAFSQPLTNFDTSNVVYMDNMFSGAGLFDQPLAKFNTSKVTTMRSMFNLTGEFNQPIGEWDTSSVTDMSGMFYYASKFNQDLSGWTVSNISNHEDFEGGNPAWVETTPRPPF